MGKSKFTDILPIAKYALTFLLGGLFYAIFSWYNNTGYIKGLEHQIANRDSLIKEIQTSNLTSKPLDSILHNAPRNNISTDDLIRYTNDLVKRNNIIEDSLEFYRTYYNLSKRSTNPNFSVKNEGNSRTYSYQSRSLDIDTVNSILKSGLEKSSREWSSKLNEEYKRSTELENKLNMYKKAIDKYGIQFNNIKKEGNTISYDIEAPQVDSALLLLPFYRKELKYDSKKRQWTIGIKRFF